MEWVLFFFWLLAAVLFYAYIGYPLIVWLITARRQNNLNVPHSWPHVTCIIACYNEEKVIEEKIKNTLELDYPLDKLTIIVINDGSTDETSKAIGGNSRVQIINLAERKGKSAALNAAMQRVVTPFVVFSDANALLNPSAFKCLMRHFDNSKVGGVAGEKKLATVSGIGAAEGWYWSYESILKKLDAAFYSVIGATGELFAMRAVLFRPLKENIILDDFFLSMHICHQGFRIAYDQQAYAVEQPSQNLSEEFHRKVRIAAGAFQSFTYVSLNNLISLPRLLFQLFSRRWLRWLACPFAIPLLLLLNMIIVYHSDAAVYFLLLVLQLIFYVLAAIGALTLRHNRWSLFTLPFYFLFMNYCMICGMFVFIKGEQTVFWNKAERINV